MKILKAVIAGLLTITVLGGLCVAYTLSNNDPFPNIPGVTFFGVKPEDVSTHRDLIEYQNYDQEHDAYDPDLIRRGEEAEEKSQERAKEWQEDVMDGADIRDPDDDAPAEYESSDE